METDMKIETDMERETDMEMERDMETETETDNTRIWTWPRTRTWTWNWQTFVKYSIRCNCPYSAIWNASEIAGRNFQWAIYLSRPFNMKKNHTAVGIAFQMMC
jgi:hypothetical protein